MFTIRKFKMTLGRTTSQQGYKTTSSKVLAGKMSLR